MTQEEQLAALVEFFRLSPADIIRQLIENKYHHVQSMKEQLPKVTELAGFEHLLE